MAKDKNIDSAVVVTGYAKAPKGTAMYELYNVIGVVLKIDAERDIILDGEFTFLTKVAKDFMRDIVVGFDLKDGIEPLLKLVEKKYWAPTQQALLVALKIAYQRYCEKKSSLEDHANGNSE